MHQLLAEHRLDHLGAAARHCAHAALVTLADPLQPMYVSAVPALPKYFSTWRQETFRCACGWSGTADAMAMEPFAELAEYSCPKCDVHLILVSYPTGDEVKTAAAAGNEEAQHMLHQVAGRKP